MATIKFVDFIHTSCTIQLRHQSYLMFTLIWLFVRKFLLFLWL